MSTSAEFLVIGAGPAGCTVATFLARAGKDVLLIDRAESPPDKVGESLLPACAEILEELGVDMTHFKVKHGAVFTSGDQGVRFPFADALRPDWPFAWQTPRGKLDGLMREVARDAGARFEVREVTDFDLPRVETTTGDIHATWVVDAAGRGQLLARKLGIRQRHPTLKNAAVHTWFTGVEPQFPEEDGDIALCAFEGGWFWLIPFADGQWSVGAVTTPDGPRGANRFEQALARCPAAAERLQNATRTRPFSGADDISVSSERFYGDGWVLLGDAATFLDPIFSTGVSLGLHGGRSLAHALIEGSSLDHWEQGCRDAVEAFVPLVDAFYDGSFMDVALAHPDRQQATVRKAIVSLLAGDVFDPEFAPPRRFGKRFPSIHRMVTA